MMQTSEHAHTPPHTFLSSCLQITGTLSPCCSKLLSEVIDFFEIHKLEKCLQERHNMMKHHLGNLCTYLLCYCVIVFPHLHELLFTAALTRRHSLAIFSSWHTAATCPMFIYFFCTVNELRITAGLKLYTLVLGYISVGVFSLCATMWKLFLSTCPLQSCISLFLLVNVVLFDKLTR